MLFWNQVRKVKTFFSLSSPRISRPHPRKQEMSFEKIKILNVKVCYKPFWIGIMYSVNIVVKTSTDIFNIQ